jgi:hypothetical protein
MIMIRMARRQRVLLLVLGVALLASGCQATSFLSKDTHLDNERFMSIWQGYNACKVAANFHSAHSEWQRLSSAALSSPMGREDEFVLPLPTKVRRLVSEPTNRLAVDVRAMAAACSLHAGQLALYEGRIEAARELFSAVLSYQKTQKDLSPYYANRAKRFLTELDRGVAISLNLSSTTP